MQRFSVHHPAELPADVEAGDKEVSAAVEASPATGGSERKCGSVLCDGKRAHVPEAHWTFVPSCAHPECEKCLVSEYAHECEYEHPCDYRLEVL
jgi:hypothetical protein